MVKKFIIFLLSVLIVVSFVVFRDGRNSVFSLEGDRQVLELGQFELSAVSTQSKTVTVEFMNQSSNTLSVIGWKTSCGCMSVSPDAAEVPSGERLVAEISLSTKVGGSKIVWLQPKLLQSDNASVVELRFQVPSTNQIRATSSIITLGEEGMGILNLICVSPFHPNLKLLITTSEGLGSKFSGWTELTATDVQNGSEGAIWQSKVEVVGQYSAGAWVQIETENQSIGLFPVRK